MRPEFPLLLGPDDVHDGVDQRQVRERLGEVAQLTPGAGIDLLGVQRQWAGVRKQLLAQGTGAGQLADLGERQRARDICEKVLSYASPLLLYGEEIDPRSGRHLGNFPQAFTHLALINAVMHVIRKEQAAQRLAVGREVPEREP